MSVATRKRRLLGQVATAGFAIFGVAVLMLMVGDPIWNFFVIAFGFLIALPVAIAALVWRARGR